MAFTSHIFLFYFLPAFLLLYYIAPRRWPAVRNILLLAAGYVFYAWVSVQFAALLFGLTVVNYVLSRFIAASAGTRMRAWLTGLAIAIDLAVLGFFKYIVFVEENVNSILLLFGRDALPVLRIVLPVGISFYTFKIISYIGFMLPKKTPAPVVAALNKEINAILATDTMRAWLDKQGMVAVGGTADDFKRQIETDYRARGELVRALGITGK